MTHIKKVIPKENYKLEVDLENGSMIILDFSEKLKTIRFGMFEDEVFFKAVSTDGNLIRWHNKVELSVREVFQMAEREG